MIKTVLKINNKSYTTKRFIVWALRPTNNTNSIVGEKGGGGAGVRVEDDVWEVVNRRCYLNGSLKHKVGTLV